MKNRAAEPSGILSSRALREDMGIAFDAGRAARAVAAAGLPQILAKARFGAGGVNPLDKWPDLAFHTAGAPAGVDPATARRMTRDRRHATAESTRADPIRWSSCAQSQDPRLSMRCPRRCS